MRVLNNLEVRIYSYHGNVYLRLKLDQLAVTSSFPPEAAIDIGREFTRVGELMKADPEAENIICADFK